MTSANFWLNVTIFASMVGSMKESYSSSYLSWLTSHSAALQRCN